MEVRDAVAKVVRELKVAGHQAYLVGGCVRDTLLGLAVKDYDVATSAQPDDVAKVFLDVKFVGASFGVCIVTCEGHHFEVATFRRDGKYSDNRRPDSVEFGTIREDAMRRDFTVNALYMDPDTGEIVDYVRGLEDLKIRHIACVGDPKDRFSEDALRLLRAVRIASKIGFGIKYTTMLAIKEMAHTIRNISAERVRDELTGMLMGPRPAHAFFTLAQSGLLDIILPEVAALQGVKQGRKHHPEGDVFEHTLLCIKNLELKTPATCWATLLHDIGKPSTQEIVSDDEVHFYEHEHVGAGMAEKICERLRFSLTDAFEVFELVNNHMRPHFAMSWGNSATRRYLGLPEIEKHLAVHKSDLLSSDGLMETYDLLQAKLTEFRQRQEPPMPPCLLNGHDLIAMGFKPGPIFGEILHAVQEKQLEEGLNDAGQARAFVAQQFTSLAGA